MPTLFSARTRALALAATALVALGSLSALPAFADTVPLSGTAETVSTDPLPTVQIDGIVWSQVIIGNTVYAGGSFTSARPAGAASGVNETPRTSLLAYNLTTGALITSFNPVLNGNVYSLAASPDGSTLYVGGNYTTVNGVKRNRIAAFNVSTGTLIGAFAPSMNASVYAIKATSSVVYLGGNFTTAAGISRSRAAAVTAGTGALLPFAPVVAGGTVRGIAVSPDETKVVVAGQFTTVNGSGNPGYGMAAVDAATGLTFLPWAAAGTVRNGGANAAIYSLTSDTTGVYGSGYTFGTGGNLEGSFRADWATGSVVWVESCLGDSYSVSINSTTMYLAGHPHNCSTAGGFPQTTPDWTWQRGMAWSKDASSNKNTGTWAAQNVPNLLNWWPDFNTGTVSGANQGPWSTAANDQYAVYGGEFTRVNETAQQGLVRFAVRSIAPDLDGPRLSGSSFVATATSIASGAVKLSWLANYDRDNQYLTYSVIRDGVTASPIYTTTAASRIWWDRPTMGYLDTGLTPGSTHTYRLKATDPYGNTALGDAVTVTVSGAGASLSAYAATVLNDGASSFWRLDQTAGSTTVADLAGNSPAVASAGVTAGTTGAIAGDADTASTFSGTSTGLASTQTAVAGPNTFTIEAWFKSTSTTGGKIVGFGNSKTGTSGSYDRHIYLTADGKVNFGVYPGAQKVVTSPTSYNNGQWHQVVATLSSTGMTLSVDGVQVGSRIDATSAEAYNGYWRIGGDTAWAGAAFLAGSIDDVSIYPTALAAATIAQHYQVAKNAAALNIAPTSSFTSTTTGMSITVDGSGSTDTDGTIASYAWAFGDGTSSTGATASHTYAAPGNYSVTLTVTDSKGATGASSKIVSVVAPNLAPVAAFTTSATNLSLVANGTASTDVDGSVASYAWSFGDGGVGTNASANHTYAAAGTYTVTLTVTDDKGATNSASKSISVTSAAAAYATDSFDRTVTSGLGSAETGGAWTTSGGAASFAVGSSAASVTTPAGSTRYGYLAGVSAADTEVRGTASFALPSAGSVYAGLIARRVAAEDYRARAVVAATGTVQLQLLRTATTLATANIAGLSYASGDQLQFRVQAFGTAPTTIRAKVWKVGTAEPADWQVTVTDSTAALQSAGSIGVYSYVSASANSGAVVAFDSLWSGSTSSSPVVPIVNVAPTAVLTSSSSALLASFDGSGSADSDGSVTSFAWSFGDGTTATGATTTHTYAAAGTYTVSLTVTDNSGATGVETGSISVSTVAAPTSLASDAFTRTVTGSWGTSTLGGAWTSSSGTASYYSVDGSTGRLTTTAAAKTAEAYLTGVTTTSADVSTTVSLSQPNTGASVFASVIGRRIGTDDYRARVVVAAGGAVSIQLQRSGTTLTTVAVSGLTYMAGDKLQVRLQVTGTNPTTIRAKVWKSGGTEPIEWSASATDSTALLQAAGHTGLGMYVGSGLTSLPLSIAFDEYLVTAVQ
ncbi:PKD domain-containing protein [Naasia lichenicola]|uniref:PKD domain-containing protein n=1 Tax=Naasia lichenicola TaxID=2565933 RepID=A0A4S4FNF3_9MICO|nr:PKD domain-containing protein [Naasia lichenicola]THG30796.1 PKD domain-containing protein [Naasia lichenicola]